jgi:hypothetical protein
MKNMKNEAVHLAELSLELAYAPDSNRDGRRAGRARALQHDSGALATAGCEALDAARRAGVTQLEYIRARIAIEAGIFLEGNRIDGAGDDQC